VNDRLTWTTETRRLGELVPWPRNPRQIRQDQARRLSESLDEFGQVDVIAVGPGGEVYNGHQRLNVWAEEHGPDMEVVVRVASRALTEKEREKLVVLLHRGATGEWDFDVLANEFELGELLEWGFEERDFGFESYGDTSTGRDGQGVTSTWDQVRSAPAGRVIIDDIETRLPEDVIELLKTILIGEFEQNDRPIHETLEAIVIAGVRAFEAGDS
jgi:hypothetical protein